MNEWILVGQDERSTLSRLVVPGGWLYREEVHHNDAGFPCALAVGLTFVPGTPAEEGEP